MITSPIASVQLAACRHAGVQEAVPLFPIKRASLFDILIKEKIYVSCTSKHFILHIYMLNKNE